MTSYWYKFYCLWFPSVLWSMQNLYYRFSTGIWKSRRVFQLDHFEKWIGVSFGSIIKILEKSENLLREKKREPDFFCNHVLILSMFQRAIMESFSVPVHLYFPSVFSSCYVTLGCIFTEKEIKWSRLTIWCLFWSLLKLLRCCSMQ